eukprot:scaffold12546_cov22-Tisochrysis_lutea.AAC.2
MLRSSEAASVMAQSAAGIATLTGKSGSGGSTHPALSAAAPGVALPCAPPAAVTAGSGGAAAGQPGPQASS